MSMLLNSVAVVAGMFDPSFASVTFLSEFATRYLTDESSNALQVSMSGINVRSTSAVFGTGASFCASQDNGSAAVVNDNTAIYLSNSDFTIECWVKSDVQANISNIIAGRYYTSQRSWKLYLDTTNKYVKFTCSTDGTTDTHTAYFRCGTTNDGVTWATLFDNNWHHISVTRTSGTIVVHVDGKHGANTASIGTTAIADSLTTYVMVGSQNNAAATKVASNLGWSATAGQTALIDEFRITVGAARYSTADFTPATANWPRGSGSDANWSNVKLLLGFEDPFAINVYGSGTPVRPTTSSAYQSLPELVDDDGVRHPSGTVGLKWNAHACFDISGTDFCVEVFKVKQTITSGTSQIVGLWGTNKCWRISFATGTVKFEYTTDGTTIQTINFATGLTTGATYTMDLAVVLSGTAFTLYKDGAQVATGTLSGTIAPNTVYLNDFTTLANNNNGDGAPTSTRFKAVRITKSARISGSSYTVPSLPLPKS